MKNKQKIVWEQTRRNLNEGFVAVWRLDTIPSGLFT